MSSAGFKNLSLSGWEAIFESVSLDPWQPPIDESYKVYKLERPQ